MAGSDFRIEKRSSIIISCMATTANTYPALANPIWQAATTRQQHLAYGDGPVRRFYTDVVPLMAIEPFAEGSRCAHRPGLAGRARVVL
jgi:hypothetical protein